MTPGWLDKLERKIGWFALPNLALYFIALQAFGFITISLNPEAIVKLILFPDLVLNGEWWRLFTFLGIPMYNSFWFIIEVLLIYYVVNTLEQHWGEFKTLFYVFISILLTIIYSFIVNLPIQDVVHIALTLCLAVATLFPEQEIYLFMILPVRLKWLAIFVGIYVVFQVIAADFYTRIYMILVYTNYLIFFGPYFIDRMKNIIRKRNYNKNLK